MLQPHLQPGPRQPPCHPHCAGQTWLGTAQRVAVPHPAGPPAAAPHPALLQGVLDPLRGRVLYMWPPLGAAAATLDAQQQAGTSQPPANSRKRHLWVLMLGRWVHVLPNHHSPRLMAEPSVVASGWTQTKEWHEQAPGMGGDLGEDRAICAKALGLDITGKARGVRSRKAGRGQTHAWDPHARTKPEIRGEPSNHRCNNRWTFTVHPHTGVLLSHEKEQGSDSTAWTNLCHGAQ